MEDINSINEVDMDYRLDYYLQQEWETDSIACTEYKASLASRHFHLVANDSNRDDVKVTSDYFDLFWMPDTFIDNAKTVQMQSQVISTQSLRIKLTPNDTCQMTFFARLVLC